MDRVKANPPKRPVPTVAGRPVANVLAEEETNNRACLKWMLERLCPKGAWQEELGGPRPGHSASALIGAGRLI